MPDTDDPPPIGEQLADALEAAKVSQKELARRLAGTGDPGKIETKRRWIGKVMKNKIRRPGMAEVERVLSLPPGHFQLPPRGQAQRQRDRLGELEDEVAWLREWVSRGFEALGVATEIQDEARQALDAHGDLP